MKEYPKISIIVPIYKVEHYLHECINSLVNQTYTNIEIILIDDGSPDNCGKICDKYMQKDSRIKVFHKENAGTASARNVGLDNSTGEWITFVDADDWLEKNALEQILYLIKHTDAEVIGFNHFYNQNDRQWKRVSINPDPLICSGDEELKWLILGSIFPHYCVVKNKFELAAIRGVWSKVFKRSFLENNNLRFDKNVNIAEDAIFCLDVFANANKIILHDIHILHYRIHNTSQIRTFHPNAIQINERAILCYYERIKQYLDTDEDYKNAFMGMLYTHFFHVLKNYIFHEENKKNISRKMLEIRDLFQKPVWNLVYAYRNINYLPRGKKELAYCIKRKWFWGVYFVGLLSVWYVKFKRIK
jgi:glycosyltransferase involved in cell wall biosynthesis